MNNGNNISLSKSGETGIAGGGHKRDDEDRKLFLGGLSWDTTEGDLKEYFSKYGDVENVSVKFDANTGNPRGFGFITFASEKTIDGVLKDVPHTIRDKQIDPKRAKSRPICKKVFVGGIDANISEDEIKKYFMQYGKVEQIELPFDRVKQRRREFVFVIFDDEMSAELACREPKQRIGDRECDIKKAQPQPVAQQQKQLQRGQPGGYGEGDRLGSRAPRGRGGSGYGSRNPNGSSYGTSYDSSSYSDSGYGSTSTGYGWDGYGYNNSTAPASSGNGYADYYAGYYGQGYDYNRPPATAPPGNSYYGYGGYEGGDGYSNPGYGSDYYPPPQSGGKVVRGKSSSSAPGYHPYPRSGPSSHP